MCAVVLLPPRTLRPSQYFDSHPSVVMMGDTVYLFTRYNKKARLRNVQYAELDVSTLKVRGLWQEAHMLSYESKFTQQYDTVYSLATMAVASMGVIVGLAPVVTVSPGAWVCAVRVFVADGRRPGYFYETSQPLVTARCSSEVRSTAYPAASTWAMASEGEVLLWVIKGLLGDDGERWSEASALHAVRYPLSLIEAARRVALADRTTHPDNATRCCT